MGEDEFVRVKLGQVGERLIATPLSRGAGVIMSMVRADGTGAHPALFGGRARAAPTSRSSCCARLDEIRRTVVAIGSHDLALDLLSNALARRAPGTSLASANVGSLGGLLALAARRGSPGGLAPARREHRRIQRQLHPASTWPTAQIVLVHLAGRVQGLIVPPGNPQALRTWRICCAPDVQFVNRQRGSGTRVLLDYQLGQLGLAAGRRSAATSARSTPIWRSPRPSPSGAADTGLGILAAARALDLDFVPLFNERTSWSFRASTTSPRSGTGAGA